MAAKEEPVEQTQARGKIASMSPGRLRVRLHPEARKTRHLDHLHQRLSECAGVERVETNPRTGSVVVHYDHHAMTLNDALDLIHDCGVLFEPLIEPPSPEELALHRTRSTVASDISSSVDNLDRQIAHLTGRKVDLRLLFPAGLFALALRQIFVEGFGLNQVPGYVLLWYAFDSFWKLHRELPSARPAIAAPANGAVSSSGMAPLAESGRG